MGEDMPQDPMSALAESATQAHELYRSYVDAGFTEAQAMKILCEIIRIGIQQGQSGGQP